MIMNQHFIIRYKVEDDIPVCPDHILNELKTHVEIIQSKIEMNLIKKAWQPYARIELQGPGIKKIIAHGTRVGGEDAKETR
jgi:hypothetical protein